MSQLEMGFVLIFMSLVAGVIVGIAIHYLYGSEVREKVDRKKELLEAIENDIAITPLIYEMVYLEEQLDGLRKLPKIKVHPKDPTKQKATPAAKLYKEMLQQYTNIVRILLRATGNDVEDEESPLRKWAKQHADQK